MNSMPVLVAWELTIALDWVFHIFSGIVYFRIHKNEVECTIILVPSNESVLSIDQSLFPSSVQIKLVKKRFSFS